MTQRRRVAIVGGNRIPFARSMGPYATASKQDMRTAALEGLIERFSLHGLRMGEVVTGAGGKRSRDFNLARECGPGSRLSAPTRAYDTQPACGAGPAAASPGAQQSARGQRECGSAGGAAR
ncbi:acetyl-CoA C-acyltransferase, partial [Pseudomonas syringae]